MGKQLLVLLVAILLAGGPLLGIGDIRGGPATVPVKAIEIADAIGTNPPHIDKATAMSGFGRAFIENRGQVAGPEVRFYAQGDPMSVALTPTGIVLTLKGPEQRVPGVQGGSRGTAGGETSIKLAFDGRGPVEPVGGRPLGYPSNFILGKDRDGSVKDARSFAEVTYADVWHGVDLRFYFKEGKLKYDVVLDAGADLRAVALVYEGVAPVSVDPATGELVVPTALGELRDERPTVSQEGTGTLPCRFELRGDRSFGFEVPLAISPDLPMVIDPGIVFSTYLGGSNYEVGRSVAVDGQGNVYVGGQTRSDDFPATIGAYGDSLGGLSDAYVLKLDPSGSSIIWATFFGGSGDETLESMVITSTGQVYVVGSTTSVDFPVPAGEMNRTYLGGARDGYVARLDATGSDLLDFTYVGGSDDDCVESVSLGPLGDVFIAGDTWSPDLYVSAGAYCMTYEPGSEMAMFAMRLDSGLQQMKYGTYVNGGRWEQPCDIRVDPMDRAYVVGATNSSDFPVTTGAYATEFHGTPDTNDGFVLALSQDGKALAGSTYLGGDGNDGAYGISLLSNGSVLVTGFTASLGLATAGAAYPLYEGGYEDAFLAMFDGGLTGLLYCTYLGGNGLDEGRDVVLGVDGRTVYVAGYTTSTDLGFTQGCADNVAGGDANAFLLGFNLSANEVTYLTAFGGSDWDVAMWGSGLAIEASGSLVMVGMTGSRDLITSPGAYGRTLKGVMNAFAVMIDPRSCGPPEAPRDLTVHDLGDGWANLTWAPARFEGSRILGYNVYKGTSPDLDGHEERLPTATNWLNDTAAVTGTTYYYHVTALDTAGEGPANTTLVKPMGLPGKPTGLTNTSSDGMVHLGWAAPTYTGGNGIPVLGYVVRRAVSAAGLSMVENTMGDVNVTEFNDTPPLKGIAYYYAVMAYNERGLGAMSDVRRAAAYSPPSEPTNVKVVEGDHGVRVTWDTASDDGGADIVDYRVMRQVGGGDRIEVARVLVKDKREFQDSGLANGVAYIYYVIASNAYGPGRAGAVNATPYGLPIEPTGLTVVERVDGITLSWTAPSGNGRTVDGYEILRIEVGRSVKSGFYNCATTSMDFGDIVLGYDYNLSVRAHNLRGYGEWSAEYRYTMLPETLRPSNLSRRCTTRGVNLTWDYPLATTGFRGMVFVVYRGEAQDSLAPVGEVANATRFLDTTAEPGRFYYYAVLANNTRLEGPRSDLVSVLVTTVPGPVRGFTVEARNGSVVLAWSAPSDDGYSPIERYVVFRGGSSWSLVELGGSVNLTYTDTAVSTGRTYFYKILAVNNVSLAEEGDTVSVHFDVLGPPSGLSFTVEDGRVHLTWSAPGLSGSPPVTGYVVYRGASTGDMTVVAQLGSLQGWTDDEASRGKVYYYTVAALNGVGRGENATALEVKVPAEVKGAGAGWLLPILAGIVLIIVVLALVNMVAVMRGREEPVEGAGAAAPVPSTPAGGDPTAVEAGGPSYIVEELLVVFRDGRLIADCSREGCKTRDADLVSGMLIAVQGIIQDGLEHGGELHSINYGENVIKIVKGRHVNIAAVVYGTPEKQLVDELEAAVQRIEASYAGIIEEWVGDLSSLTEVDSMVRPIIERTANLTREQVGAVEERKAVSMLSAIDFFKGYVRLNVAVSNATEEAIMDVAVEAHYDRDMLRLERVRPETLEIRGDRVQVGNLMPGERKTVSLLFDPQICQSTYIDGTLFYYDTRGEVHRVEMKRRTAEVVCPIFFTRKQANTAMLRRLIAERLHASDLRTFKFPGGMSPREVLELAKRAFGGMDVQLVREYVVEGPPLEAEVWYYGETKVKQFQIVTRLGVLERERALELFVASTSMEPVTGLLAELRREVDGAVRERSPESPGLTLERDETVQKGLAGRAMLIDTMPD